MELIYLQAVLMDNGEIICKGKTIAWEKDVKEFIVKEKNVDILKVEEEEEEEE